MQQHFPFSLPALHFSLFAFIALALNGCATSPLGRSQLNLMPPSQMSSMGKSNFEQMKKATAIETETKLINYVRCVAIPIVKQVVTNPAEVNDWEIVVFHDSQVNAFALPGKKIGVYTGILPVAKSGGQLGAVLGHEAGHVLANHGNERVSQTLIVQAGLTASSLALADHQSPEFKLIGAALGLGAQYGILLPFSRTQESEADIIGLKLMARAGFNPEEAVELWENMSKQAGASPPEFMSTHPANSTRIQNLQNHLAEAKVLYEKTNPADRPQCHL